MFEHAVYSVISPEGCASILWRSGDKAQTAAEALRLTAQDMHALGVIDQIVEEPLGGAHRNIDMALQNLAAAIEGQLQNLSVMDAEALIKDRREKYLNMGDKALI
jgi:acetyl-CoA carboxylase carboxyl transferase subunit alpha